MSPIISNVVALLALSGTALALPKPALGSGSINWAPTAGSGTGRGGPLPTGAYLPGRIPVPDRNGTRGPGNGTRPSLPVSSLPPLTVSVLPVPAASSTGAAAAAPDGQNGTDSSEHVTLIARDFSSGPPGEHIAGPQGFSNGGGFGGGGASTQASESSSAAESAATTSSTSATVTSESSTSSATTSSASSTSTSSSSSDATKRGLSYNSASLLSAFTSSEASWAYNWAASADGTLPTGIEYVPMLWGLDAVSGWAEAAATAIASGSTHVLSFNEPDLSTQSNIDAATAATNHITYMNPLASEASIGSPAITNGDSADMGINWLSSFFTACNSECKVDFVAFHWYGSVSALSDFQSHVSSVISTASTNGVDKVWLTEFGTTDGTDDEIASFVTSAITWLDEQSAVERYAYFMAGESSGELLTSAGALSTIGEAYVS